MFKRRYRANPTTVSAGLKNNAVSKPTPAWDAVIQNHVLSSSGLNVEAEYGCQF